MKDKNISFLFELIFFILSVKYIQCVPIDYCLYEVNTTDCGLPPTPVFAYYKPGSRCELETWRGCPTYNKFENEYECSDICIGRLGKNNTEGDVEAEIEKTIMQIPETHAKLLHEVVNDISKKIVNPVGMELDTTPFAGAYVVDTLFFPVNMTDLFSDKDGDTSKSESAEKEEPEQPPPPPPREPPKRKKPKQDDQDNSLRRIGTLWADNLETE